MTDSRLMDKCFLFTTSKTVTEDYPELCAAYEKMMFSAVYTKVIGKEVEKSWRYTTNTVL